MTLDTMKFLYDKKIKHPDEKELFSGDAELSIGGASDRRNRNSGGLCTVSVYD